VTGALGLLFATRAMVICFADHLMHSIQGDAIAKRVERDTLLVARSRLGDAEARTPTPPPMGGAGAFDTLGLRAAGGS
jgi:uncharacterized membrane protein